MYGGRLTFRQWLLGLAPDSSDRLADPGRPEASTSPTRRPVDPLRPPAGGGDTSRSGSPHRVNATPPVSTVSGRLGNEGSRAGTTLPGPAATLPAHRAAGLDRDRAEGTDFARGIQTWFAIALLITGVALAAFAPLTNGRTNGVHMWAGALAFVGGAYLWIQLYRHTRHRS